MATAKQKTALQIAIAALRQIAKPETPGDVCAIDPKTIATAALTRMSLIRLKRKKYSLLLKAKFIVDAANRRLIHDSNQLWRLNMENLKNESKRTRKK
jgi:hypothetical protein